MSNILIACPMGKEAAALQEQLPGNWSVEASGLGIKRSVPFLLKRFRENRPDVLVFTGSVGQLDLSISMGDIVLPRSWALEQGPSFDCSAELCDRLEAAGWPTDLKGLTLGQAVLKSEQREALFRSTGARTYDTVTAAVVRVCRTEGIPCITPKIVASTVESGLMTFWVKLDKNIAPLAKQLTRFLPVIADGFKG